MKMKLIPKRNTRETFPLNLPPFPAGYPNLLLFPNQLNLPGRTGGPGAERIVPFIYPVGGQSVHIHAQYRGL